ncbi:hypothetical protein [Flavivirga sp. 57AJ16]|uniref:hypothetical protein n=1 Tax=Flavivirga sp. 57AJ16 TaxID=3025307 RepID=UPI002364FF3B|nr:hypothetical protein [Flavivirga sp. 57AJ16]MDD7885511.1 hypothetical protein [Flavivirga sp. 57AJ16]
MMVKRGFFFISMALCFINMTCEEGDKIDLSSEICDQKITVNRNLFTNLESAHFTFVNAQIIEDCLTLEISASGCDGHSWGFNLVDSGAVAESSPEQRSLKLQLLNKEACLAVFKRTISFDLRPLQINGSHEIILHLEGLETSLRYKY